MVRYPLVSMGKGMPNYGIDSPSCHFQLRWDETES